MSDDYFYYSERRRTCNLDSSSHVMDDCQDVTRGEKGRQRPLYVGSFLLGLGLSCLFFVYPSMMISHMEVSETKANHLMALICVMAAFSSPMLAFGKSASLYLSLVLFMAFVTCHICQFVGLGWNYFAAGPFLAFIQWGHLSLLPGKAKTWLVASRGLPHLVTAILLLAFFQSKEALLSFNLIILALAGLCQLVFNMNSQKATSIQPKSQSKHVKKLANFIYFYLKDNHLCLILPMVFFTGLYEGFMAKHFIMVSYAFLKPISYPLANTPCPILWSQIQGHIVSRAFNGYVCESILASKCKLCHFTSA